jgi:hypothetical protein
LCRKLVLDPQLGPVLDLIGDRQQVLIGE